MFCASRTQIQLYIIKSFGSVPFTTGKMQRVEQLGGCWSASPHLPSMHLHPCSLDALLAVLMLLLLLLLLPPPQPQGMIQIVELKFRKMNGYPHWPSL